MSRLDAPRAVADARPLERPMDGALRACAAAAGDCLELTKPRIVALELFVAAAAARLAAPHGLDLGVVFHALAGTALVAGSASIANQWLERGADARMPRTASRPLPSGRVSGATALALSATGLFLGMWWLLARVNALTAGLGLLSWLLYVVVYTPLKSRTPLNTVVGAVAGALPLLMGWTATSAPLTIVTWAFAAVLFLWQFPHFMAIAWLYRADYAAAGHRMCSVVDPTGARCGALAVVGAAALIPVSLIPAIQPHSGSPMIYGLWAVALGAGQLACALQFALQRTEPAARQLLRGTLLYLPAWLTMLLIVAV